MKKIPRQGNVIVFAFCNTKVEGLCIAKVDIRGNKNKKDEMEYCKSKNLPHGNLLKVVWFAVKENDL